MATFFLDFQNRMIKIMWHLKLPITFTAQDVSYGIFLLETYSTGWGNAGAKKGLSFVKILKIIHLEAWCRQANLFLKMS